MTKDSLLSENIETLRLEFKRTEKFVENTDSEKEEWGKSIVAFANRYGGKLIIGKNDADGGYEGKGIFDKFKQGSKSGIDKLKEKIDNFCLNRISPPIICDVQFDGTSEDGDLLVVNIPQRTSMPHAIIKDRKEIVSRKYYIRTCHGSVPISSDKQLEWLFKCKNEPNIYTEANCELDFPWGSISPLGSKHHSHHKLPFLENFGFFLNRYVPKMNSEDILKKYFFELTRSPFAELSLFVFLFHCFTQLESFGLNISDLLRKENFKKDKIFSLSEEQKYSVIPLKDFLLKYKHIWQDRLGLSAYGSDLPDPFYDFLFLPTGSIITIEKDEHRDCYNILNIKHKYFNFRFNFFASFGSGLSHTNPYSYMIRYPLNNNKVLDKSMKEFLNISLRLTYEAKFDFPEENFEFFDEYYNFANLIKEFIETRWDYKNCLKNMDYHYTLYNIEHRMEQLCKKFNIELTL